MSLGGDLMGEKGNVTSGELVGTASGVGAVVASAGTQVTAVFEEAAGNVRDKIVDKGADAGIATATEKWKQRGGDGESSTDADTPS
jgi:hypothetical protein